MSGADDEVAPARPTWTTLRARLEAQGFRPSRALGQNFLRDPNLARAIVADARVAAGDRVLEVGPGCGFLSLELVARGVELLAVEIDPRLARIVGELLAPHANARLLHADVLAGKHRLAPEVAAALWPGEPWHVVANLPYSAGTPFLLVASRLEEPPRSMTVLLQRELIERFAAEPGTRAWGPAGARLRLLYDVRVLRSVAPELFWPRPQVESTLARLELRAARPDAREVRAYDRLVEGLFQARRKTLTSRLGDLLGGRAPAAAALEACGLDGGARPETLGVDQLLDLARHCPPLAPRN